MYKVEVFKGAHKQWYWRIVHRNKNILATSEGYTRKASAMTVARRVAGQMTLVDVEAAREVAL